MALTEREAETEAGPEQAEEFFPIPLAVMQPGTVAPVDLYLFQKSPPGYTLYKTADTPLNDEVRERLILNGVGDLYMRAEDEEAYCRYVEEQINAILQDDLLEIEKAWPVVYQASSHVMEDLFEDPKAGHNVRRAESMVSSLVTSVLKSEDPLKHITSLIKYDYHVYTHSVNVAVLLTAACREILSIKSEALLRQVGRGAVLHDIGKSQVPREIINKPGKLTEEEFEEIKKHPMGGLKMARERVELDPVGASIIRNHHEHFDGSGYPDGLEGEQIKPVIRLSTIIDVYDAMTTKRCYAEAKPPYSALKIMVHEMKGHFSIPELRSFIVFLGPRDDSRDVRAGSWQEHKAEHTGEE